MHFGDSFRVFCSLLTAYVLEKGLQITAPELGRGTVVLHPFTAHQQGAKSGSILESSLLAPALCMSWAEGD